LYHIKPATTPRRTTPPTTPPTMAPTVILTFDDDELIEVVETNEV
jgi:hypothetical protein